jgi:hypothetical protein
MTYSADGLAFAKLTQGTVRDGEARFAPADRRLPTCLAARPGWLAPKA